MNLKRKKGTKNLHWRSDLLRSLCIPLAYGQSYYNVTLLPRTPIPTINHDEKSLMGLDLAEDGW